MHDCDTMRLGAYFDGELSERDAAIVEAHLLRCRACASELRAIRRVTSILRSNRAQTLMAEESNRLHQAISNAFPLLHGERSTYHVIEHPR